MQLGSAINRRNVALGAAGLLSVCLWSSMGDYDLSKQVQWAIGRPIFASQDDVFDFPVLDSGELREICSNTDWNSSLVFTCDNNHGGVGRVRNSILNCVRYAIGAGGALVVPTIATRDMDDLDPGHGHHGDEEEGEEDMEAALHKRHGVAVWKEMDYMFDQDHFVGSLKKSCPDLVLIPHMERSLSGRRRGLIPEMLFHKETPASGIEHPETWPDKLDGWIKKYITLEPATEPIVVDLEQSFLQYPTHSDGKDLAHHFGHILKFRTDVRRLATAVLKEIPQRCEIRPFDLSRPIINPSFLGVHLGTEIPLAAEKRHEVDITYNHYEAQAIAYIRQATSSKIATMYVASGNFPDVVKLQADAGQKNIVVTYKEDLLHGKLKEELKGLTWDQRALVDFLVLLKGQEFAGIGHSSFSWNVMMKRHEMGDAGVRELLVEPGIYQDSISKLYGAESSNVESSRCMWP